ncbi:MAG: PAS-domain containing protein [Novosphingobium sp.]|nr:PAS-domain containing protein [Novosphingobium sp.]
MQIEPAILVLVAALLAVWTFAAGIAIVAARRRQRRAEAIQRNARRLARMIDESPALPLLVRADGRIEASQRLAHWLGLETVPGYLSELDAGDKGLSDDTLAELTAAVLRTQMTAAPFRMVATPRGSSRSLALRGHLADPQVSPGGAALVWVFDFSDSESELVTLRRQADAARRDFESLVTLIEAAPMPMWFREPGGDLRLVNAAYVSAVAGENADAVVAAGTELVEAVDGRSARDIALGAASQGRAVERTAPITIDGQRRTFRVSDLPLGDEGIAGYAVDIEDMEELGRSFRAFRDAQRSMIDQLSAGVAQFDARRMMTFANQPFQRIFSLQLGEMADQPQFERFLDAAHEAARTPEIRDFPQWRRERADWFASGESIEENWSLPDGSHLRIIAHPVPDGGLLLIAEDRTEQLRLSAMRDTLLRTRTATFDSLFESVAVFAPDGRLQLWNRRFASDWGLEDEQLDGHPHVEELLETIGPQLANPEQAKSVGDTVRAATLDRKQRSGRVALADGRTLEFAGVPLPDGNGLLTVLDITDSQKAAEALRERNEALVEADAVKTRFLANMSTELRTPLTSIGGFAELLQSGLGGDLSESGGEYVTAILSSVERLTEQIESLLDLSQSEAGLLPLASEEIALEPFLRKLADERSARVNEAGLTLEFQQDGASETTEGDRRRLSRAIGHLLDNAIAATPPGGRVLLMLSRESHEDNGWTRIVVSDSGRGMDSATLARALEGLGEEGLARRQGIGLPLARQIIEAHGGTLEVVSQPGEGTAAIVDLP